MEQILKYPDHHNNGGKPLAWTPAPVSLGVLGEGCETDYPQHWQLTAGKTWRQFTDEAMFAVYNYYVRTLVNLHCLRCADAIVTALEYSSLSPSCRHL